MDSYRQCHLLYAQSNMLSRKCGMSPAPHADWATLNICGEGSMWRAFMYICDILDFISFVFPLRLLLY